MRDKEKTDEARVAAAPAEGAAPKKKRYAPGELVAFGTIEEITGTVGTAMSDLAQTGSTI